MNSIFRVSWWISAAIVFLALLPGCAASGDVRSNGSGSGELSNLQLIATFRTEGSKIAGQGVFSADGRMLAFPTQGLKGNFFSVSGPYSLMEVFDVEDERKAYDVEQTDSERFHGGRWSVDTPFLNSAGELFFVSSTRNDRPIDPETLAYLPIKHGHPGKEVCFRRFEFATGNEKPSPCLPSDVTRPVLGIDNVVISPDGRHIALIGSSRFERGSGTDYTNNVLFVVDTNSGAVLGAHHGLKDPNVFGVSNVVFADRDSETIFYTGARKRVFEGPKANADEPVVRCSGFINLGEAADAQITLEPQICGASLYHLLDVSDDYLITAMDCGWESANCGHAGSGDLVFDWNEVLKSGGIPMVDPRGEPSSIVVTATPSSSFRAHFLSSDVVALTRHAWLEEEDRRVASVQLFRISGNGLVAVSETVPGTTIATFNENNKQLIATAEDLGAHIELSVYRVAD